MCASVLALPRLARSRPHLEHLAPIVVPGLVVGAGAVLAFGTVHAWLIVPIWSRLPGGIPIALVTGLSLAWAFDRVARVRGWRSPVHGLTFGVYMVGTLVPATIVDAAMRLNDLRLGDTTPGLAGGVALFAVSGLLVGGVLTRNRAAAFVCAVAALALMAVAGGPLPIGRSPRAAGLSAGIGGIITLACAGIAVVRSHVSRHF